MGERKQKRNVKRYFQFGLLLIDVLTFVVSFVLIYRLRFTFPKLFEIAPKLAASVKLSDYYLLMAILLVLWIFLHFYFRAYSQVLSFSGEFARTLKISLIQLLSTMSLCFALDPHTYSRSLVILFSSTLVPIDLIFRRIYLYLSRYLYLPLQKRKHVVLIIGSSQIARSLETRLLSHPYMKVSILKPPSSKRIERMLSELTVKLSEIYLVQNDLSVDEIIEITNRCEKLEIACKIVPDWLELRRGEIVVDDLLGLPIFEVRSLSLHKENYVIKRLFDISCSIVVLICLWIPLIWIAFLIRLDSRGAILFKQWRVGLQEQNFFFYKFRTMRQDAELLRDQLRHLNERPGAVFKIKNDPRVTKIGKWLRRLSLDELPQIFNILKGDMSLVGPRPQLPSEMKENLPHANRRYRVMPGLTGLWQVSGRAALSYEEMIELDLYYIENWSIGLDLQILFRTLSVVVRPIGAY